MCEGGEVNEARYEFFVVLRFGVPFQGIQIGWLVSPTGGRNDSHYDFWSSDSNFMRDAPLVVVVILSVI